MKSILRKPDNKIWKIFSCTVITVVLCSAAKATDCPEHYSGGKAPEIANPRMLSKTRELCYEAFVVMHSGITRTPLWSSEHLRRDNVEAAQAMSRKNSFHAEDALPVGARAELSDYARSGYDRGHMSPNGDFATRSAQAESFSLANMVPQVHVNNAGVWAGIEGAARQLAASEGDLYVVTGPAFIGNDLKQVGNVLVPTHLWKVLYSPHQHRAGAYLITNDDTRTYSSLTVSDLETMIGISLLPGISQKIRDAGMDLPKPSAQRPRKTKLKGLTAEEFQLRDFGRLISDAINKAIH